MVCLYDIAANKYLKTHAVQTTTAALCCAIMALSQRFSSPQFRNLRAIFYTGCGLSSIIFVIYGLARYGWELQKSRVSLVWMG